MLEPKQETLMFDLRILLWFNQTRNGAFYPLISGSKPFSKYVKTKKVFNDLYRNIIAIQWSVWLECMKENLNNDN